LPKPHTIDLSATLANPSLLHNTFEKKLARKKMLAGERPVECEHCWKIEDLTNKNISDRVHKSLVYSEYELFKARDEHGWANNVNLITLEISFDSICNLACSYCSPGFSTTWQSDIQQNGFYQNLNSDGAYNYKLDGKAMMPYGVNNENNPYVDAFWKWWENGLSNSLRELRITGGEPLMSPNFWKLMDWWQQNNSSEVELAINTNLCAKDELIEKLISTSQNIKVLHLYTSCEGVGEKAEYVRDGLSWKQWIKNLENFMAIGKYKSVNCMMTINALTIFSMTDFIDEIIKLKLKYNIEKPVCSLNILRFPSFMSVTTLPKEMREERAFAIENWLNTLSVSDKYFIEWERDGIKRLISYLRNVDEGHSESSSNLVRRKDFKSFYKQYDKRRNKNLLTVFPEIKEWWESIKLND
jgi:organic radical activating enzyme